jgi:hypothetical protein
MLKDGREDLIDHFFEMHTKELGKPKINIDTSGLKHPELVKKMMTDEKLKPTLVKTPKKKRKESDDLVKWFEETTGKKVDPDDFASGGIARVGYFKGGKVWKEFIEGLFIKTSNDIRLGKGKWAGLTQEQWIKQHDDLTKMLKKWEWGGKKGLPEGAEQYLGMNNLQITKAIKDATKKVKSPLQKEVSERTGKVFDPKTDQYVTPGKNIKKDEVITTDGEIAKKSDKNRAPTDEEIEVYMEELPHGGEMDWYDFGKNIDELDKAVADHKAYVANQYQRYKRGDLDKYVKPEVLEEQRLFYQKKIDNVLDKAYDEVFYQKPVTGDYKLDADVLSDSIAEQLGKGAFTDLPQTHQTQIYNTALKRVTKDLQINRAKN